MGWLPPDSPPPNAIAQLHRTMAEIRTMITSHQVTGTALGNSLSALSRLAIELSRREAHDHDLADVERELVALATRHHLLEPALHQAAAQIAQARRRQL